MIFDPAKKQKLEPYDDAIRHVAHAIVQSPAVVIDLLDEIDLVGGSGVAQGTKNARTLLGLKTGAG